VRVVCVNDLINAVFRLAIKGLRSQTAAQIGSFLIYFLAFQRSPHKIKRNIRCHFKRRLVLPLNEITFNFSLAGADSQKIKNTNTTQNHYKKVSYFKCFIKTSTKSKATTAPKALLPSMAIISWPELRTNKKYRNKSNNNECCLAIVEKLIKLVISALNQQKSRGSQGRHSAATHDEIVALLGATVAPKPQIR